MKKLIVVALLALAGCSDKVKQSEKTDLQLVGQQGVHHFFTLSKPWIDDMGYVQKEAESFCASRDICFAQFWEAGTAAPKSFPLSDEEVATELAAYRINRNNGSEVMLWQCERYPESTSKNCFRNTDPE